MDTSTAINPVADSATKTIETLKSKLTGSVLLQGDEGYDTARSVWNGMIDKRPAVIVQCSNASDVIAAVHFAQNNNLVLLQATQFATEV
ncbi:MAG: hypothetical protein V4676_06565 [Bacteroidota bacterium]